MTSRKLVSFLFVILLSSVFVSAHPAVADSSHARIIRLSLVQGDVRFARETHGDPLADSSATWETAGLNLPIRQGYVLATDKGRAEVEFENGAMAFLKENTVLEFYDLSLNDSARTTRLVLRQGSVSFYVNPASGDYFSVAGGHFTGEAEHRSAFRLDNYDDGSAVQTYQGRVSVLHNKNSTRLEKGQSLSVKAGDDSSLSVGRLPEEDDFDRWVSGRIESVSTATTAASNTPVRLITLRDSPISIPMAPFPAAGPMDLVGDRLAWVSGGHPSPMGSGSWTPLLATPGSAISRGAGLLITMEVGSSIPPAAAGFIPLPFFTGTQDMEGFREGTSLAALIHLASSIIR